jgi:NAD+ kinase
MNRPARTVTLMTHRRVAEVAPAIRALADAAAEVGAVIRFDAEETRKHRMPPGDHLLFDAPLSEDVDLCVVLGGDGTILRALRRYVNTGVPVFAVNFGEVGFLATIEPEEVEAGFRLALRGAYEIVTLPALALSIDGHPQAAVNDVSIQRRPGARVAQLSYGVGEDELGSVRCDGLVVSTPAGSTGYNLANGGPVLAWGVEGYVVSFISPHSLTARALVVSPDDILAVHNRSPEPVDVSVDGRPATELGAGRSLNARFVRSAAQLAVMPGSTFYRRLRNKFGKLSS